MNIEQAKKLFDAISEEVKNNKLDTQRADKFLLTFIELMDKNKLSNGNITLFASLVAEYLFSSPKVETIKKLFPFIQIYLELIENPDSSSVYDERGILTI